MRFINGSIDNLLEHAKGKKLICYGANDKLVDLCKMFSVFNLDTRIDFVTDEHARSKRFDLGKISKPLLSYRNFSKIYNKKPHIILFSNLSDFNSFSSKFTFSKNSAFYIGEFLLHNPPDYDLPVRDISANPLIPKKLHYFWFGGNELSPLHVKCIESWRKFCPDFEIIEWNEDNYDVYKYPYMRGAYDAKIWSRVTNCARVDILYEHGGCYLDVDVELIKPIDYFLYDMGFCGLETSGIANFGNICGSVRQHPLISRLYEFYKTTPFVKETTGPMHQTNILRPLGLTFENKIQIIDDMTVYPTDVFCPISSNLVYESFTENTHTIHHYGWSWGGAEAIKEKHKNVDIIRKKLSKLGNEHLYKYPLPPVPETQLTPTPPAEKPASTNKESPTDLVKQGRIDEALRILDENLTNALNEGDAKKAEIITLEQLNAAVALNDANLIKDIRIMRLELFYHTSQRMKARDEYERLRPFHSDSELEDIRNITGYRDENTNKAEKPLLEQLETYFIVDNVGVQNNGILNSVLRKITLFEEEWGYRPTLIVSQYNQDLRKTIGHHQFSSSTRVNTGMKILNVYNYFQKTEAPNLQTIERSKNRIQNKNDNGKITHVEYYDKKGYLSRIRYYNELNSDHIDYEDYYTTDDKICIKIEYTFKNKKNEIRRIILFDDAGNVLGEGRSEADLVGFCLDQIALKSDKQCLFVSESGLHNKAMASVKQKNAIKAAVVHSVFLEDPYNLRSKPQFFFKDLVRYQNHFDGIVFLTKTEGDDFIRLYGKPQRIFTVPNFYPKEIKKADSSMRDHRRAVIVARFDPIKRMDVAIDIFKLVAEKLPDVRLDIYAFGNPGEEKRIRNHIKKTGMDNNVFIKGSTDRPEEVFSSAALSLSTSKVEGMPLSLIESICNGCPVISYDIKYGPSDIVKNGKTGHLIPLDNVKAYAKQMINYFENFEEQCEMYEAAYEDAYRFTNKVFLENWYNFMEGVFAQHQERKKGSL